MLSLFWQLVTDPARFAIDHWPSIVVVIFLATLIPLWSFYLSILRSKITWLVIGAFLLVAGSWSIRGRWDDDQFEKERAGFRDTLQEIEEAQQEAIINAKNKVIAQGVENQKNVAEALAIAVKDREKIKNDMADLQKQIDEMPDEPDVKGCPPRVDPVLRNILKSRGK